MESVTVVVLGIFVFLSFYFVLLSFYTVDEAQKEQFVFIAASSVASGVVLFACLAIYHVIKRAFSRMNNRLLDIEELWALEEIEESG